MLCFTPGKINSPPRQAQLFAMLRYLLVNEPGPIRAYPLVARPDYLRASCLSINKPTLTVPIPWQLSLAARGP